MGVFSNGEYCHAIARLLWCASALARLSRHVHVKSPRKGLTDNPNYAGGLDHLLLGIFPCGVLTSASIEVSRQ